MSLCHIELYATYLHGYCMYVLLKYWVTSLSLSRRDSEGIWLLVVGGVFKWLHHRTHKLKGLWFSRMCGLTKGSFKGSLPNMLNTIHYPRYKYDTYILHNWINNISCSFERPMNAVIYVSAFIIHISSNLIISLQTLAAYISDVACEVTTVHILTDVSVTSQPNALKCQVVMSRSQHKRHHNCTG